MLFELLSGAEGGWVGTGGCHRHIGCGEIYKHNQDCYVLEAKIGNLKMSVIISYSNLNQKQTGLLKKTQNFFFLCFGIFIS